MLVEDSSLPPSSITKCRHLILKEHSNIAFVSKLSAKIFYHIKLKKIGEYLVLRSTFQRLMGRNWKESKPGFQQANSRREKCMRVYFSNSHQVIALDKHFILESTGIMPTSFIQQNKTNWFKIVKWLLHYQLMLPFKFESAFSQNPSFIHLLLNHEACTVIVSWRLINFNIHNNSRRISFIKQDLSWVLHSYQIVLSTAGIKSVICLVHINFRRELSCYY